MKEIRQKFVEAIKAIDLQKLSVDDLHTLACAAEKVKDLDDNISDHLKTLNETLQGNRQSTSKETLKDLR